MAEFEVMDGTGPQLRAVRAALFTALCVTLSSASHVLLSRTPLPLGTVAALSVAVFAVAYALAGRERGFWSIATLLIPLELAADTIFTTGQQACYGPSGGPVAGSLRSMGVTVLCGGDLGSPLPGVSQNGVGTPLAAAVSSATPWLLLAAHVAVGLIASAWLRRGEAALSRLLASLAAFAFRPLLLAVAVHAAALRPRRRPAPRSVRPVRPAPALPLLVHSVVRRGPPCSAAA
ncbi:membrane protein [Streptomyces hygroscopicus]|nr:hypothetical protein [Streptomyces hygroscopicus]AQW50148.1 membrane protein [Streptomyces hygroscopicus]